MIYRSVHHTLFRKVVRRLYCEITQNISDALTGRNSAVNFVFLKIFQCLSILSALEFCFLDHLQQYFATYILTTIISSFYLEALTCFIKLF